MGQLFFETDTVVGSGITQKKEQEMTKTIITNMLALLSLSANAAIYECRLSGGSNNDTRAVTYEFDTSTEDDKFIDLGNGASVGCVVVRATPQLITCGIGDEVKFSLFATADDGTSVLTLDSSSQDSKSILRCIKSK